MRFASPSTTCGAVTRSVTCARLPRALCAPTSGRFSTICFGAIHRLRSGVRRQRTGGASDGGVRARRVPSRSPRDEHLLLGWVPGEAGPGATTGARRRGSRRGLRRQEARQAEGRLRLLRQRDVAQALLLLG